MTLVILIELIIKTDAAPQPGLFRIAEPLRQRPVGWLTVTSKASTVSCFRPAHNYFVNTINTQSRFYSIFFLFLFFLLPTSVLSTSCIGKKTSWLLLYSKYFFSKKQFTYCYSCCCLKWSDLNDAVVYFLTFPCLKVLKWTSQVICCFECMIMTYWEKIKQTRATHLNVKVSTLMDLQWIPR